jgi:metal-responsive CopG/Arc/MetJ family transcriptional regulator
VSVRVHISLDEALVEEIDRTVGPRRRSSYIAEAVRKRLDGDRRWEKIWSAVGSISDSGHEWDDDPAAWVHEQRRADPRRVG